MALWSKTQTMLISLKLKLNNNYNNDICLLGIHLDPRLNWSNDINKVDCKLFRFLFLLSTNLKTFVPYNCVCYVCFAFFVFYFYGLFMKAIINFILHNRYTKTPNKIWCSQIQNQFDDFCKKVKLKNHK